MSKPLRSWFDGLTTLSNIEGRPCRMLNAAQQKTKRQAFFG
jgi:hypothetical protein